LLPKTPKPRARVIKMESPDPRVLDEEEGEEEMIDLGQDI